MRACLRTIRSVVAASAVRCEAPRSNVSLPDTWYLLWSLPLRAGPDTVRCSMPALLVALLAALRSFFRSRLELEAEVLALRHQLAVLQRQAPRRPRLGRADRVLWALLSRLWPNWRGAIQIVTPDTVMHWHRRGFALYWRWKSRPRRAGRPAVGADIRALIRRDPPGKRRRLGIFSSDRVRFSL